MVPENVAEQWLHRHWEKSPYGYIPSRLYRFDLEEWPSERLCEIRTNQTDFAADNASERDFGRWLIEEERSPLSCRPWLADFMREKHCFPVPIIVLDNHDMHFRLLPMVNRSHDDLPAAHILIEGHRRFAIALYLRSINAFANSMRLWIMRPIQLSPALST